MQGKTALITGGASGIGRALGEALARRGTRVVLADRQLAMVQEVAAAIQNSGGNAEAHELDVRDSSAFAALADDVWARSGGIDYLFNNAGIGVGGEIVDYDREAWDDVFDVNVRGVAYGISAVYPRMRERGRGHIVNTASVTGLLPTPGGGSYTASKHAVVGTSKALRAEAARYGVKVSVLCPGPIQTPILTGGRYGRQVGRAMTEEQTREFWARLRPMNVDRFATEALEGVARNQAYIVLPRWWKAAWWLERLAPSASLWLWTEIHRRSREALEAAPGPSSEPSPSTSSQTGQ